MIGVCIKYFHENYGGMLQAYATVSMLEKKGIRYELIQYEKKKTISTIIRFAPRIFNRVLLNDKYEMFLKKRALRKHHDFAKNNAIRMDAFHKFEKNNFKNFSPVFRGYKELCNGSKRYSAVLTGSDQLWSPAGLPTNFYNLMFVPDAVRKVSYASSFGVAQIPWYQRRRTTNFLNRIDYISMRENRGSEIVKELTNRDVPTVLDPVFFFDKEGWEELIPVEREIKEPYIFAYFLGNNKEHRDAVMKASKELGCKIVTLRHLDQYIEEDEEFGDIALYDVGPDRFLNLLRNSKCVCTDSFHGTCFSIIHNKEFIVFNRYQEGVKHSKNSRIDSLCDNLGLNDRRFSSEEIIVEQLSKEIDYKCVEEKMNELRITTDSFLNDALDNIE